MDGCCFGKKLGFRNTLRPKSTLGGKEITGRLPSAPTEQQPLPQRPPPASFPPSRNNSLGFLAYAAGRTCLPAAGRRTTADYRPWPRTPEFGRAKPRPPAPPRPPWSPLRARSLGRCRPQSSSPPACGQAAEAVALFLPTPGATSLPPQPNHINAARQVRAAVHLRCAFAV